MTKMEPETTEVAKRSSVSVSLQLTNLADLREFCKILASTDMVPKAYKGKPDDILVAILHGQELGLPHLQALQSIAVVNGIPSVYGDAALAMVRASGKLEDFDEWIEVDGVRQSGSSFPIMKWAEEGRMIVGHCMSKRVGAKRPRTTTYSVDDAKRAKLWEKKAANGFESPWCTTPQRMLMFRPRSWNLRDEFGDVLKGMAIYEEARDIETEQGIDGTYRPELPVPVVVQPVRDDNKAKLAAAQEALKQQREQPKAEPSKAQPAKADPKPEEPKASAPPVSTEGHDAAWLSAVLDCEDFLRGSQQGKGSLRSIRAGFKIEDGSYPMMPQDQQDYLADLRRTVERMQSAEKA